MLPATIVIAGLPVGAVSTQYTGPTSETLSLVDKTRDTGLYIGSSHPITVGGTLRTVLNRSAEINISKRTVAKGQGLASLIRVKLPTQINPAAAITADVGDTSGVVMITFQRDVNLAPTLGETILSEVLKDIGANSSLLQAICANEL